MKQKIVSFFLVIVAASGCATGSSVNTKVDDCPEPSNNLSEYVIGPGDRLSIVVWRNDELSVDVPVRPDGKVSTPLIDDMRAAGKTPSQLASDMEAVLGEYLRTPKVSVIVTAQGEANQIRIVGEVNNPQSLSYRDGLRLLDVIVAVGGLTEFAAGNRAVLLRSVDDRQFECRIRIKDLLKGRLSHNVVIYAGDVIVVPETRF